MNYKLLAALLLFFICFEVTAQDTESKSLKQLQEKFTSISDFTVEFSQSANSIKTKGKFYFKQTDKIRIEFNPVVIVSDGKTIWNYNKNTNKFIISEEDGSDESGFSLNRIVFDYPSKCNIEEIKEGELNILTFTPNQTGLQFKELVLWLDEEYLIQKLRLKDAGSSVMELAFSNYKLNSGLKDSIFKIDPPEGSSIIDLR